MTRLFLFAALGAVLFLAACDNSESERISKLEKQNQELQEKLNRESAVSNYELQEKCAKDAKVWFNENWASDKTTLLLDHTNHYNHAMQKCFIVVEYHYSINPSVSWMNHLYLWDVQENVKYGHFSQQHWTLSDSKIKLEDKVFECEIAAKKCQTLEEFNNLVRPYMND